MQGSAKLTPINRKAPGGFISEGLQNRHERINDSTERRTDMKPTKYQIAVRWYPEYVCDIGEPSCFACGFYKENWGDVKQVKKRWESCQLQVCHVIPQSLGGTDSVDNLVLLCPKCHKAAPDTIDAAFMHKWIKARHKTFWNGVDLLELEHLIKLADFESLPQEIVKKAWLMALTRPSSEGVCMHFGEGYSQASMVWTVKRQVDLLMATEDIEFNKDFTSIVKSFEVQGSFRSEVTE